MLIANVLARELVHVLAPGRRVRYSHFRVFFSADQHSYTIGMLLLGPMAESASPLISLINGDAIWMHLASRNGLISHLIRRSWSSADRIDRTLIAPIYQRWSLLNTVQNRQYLGIDIGKGIVTNRILLGISSIFLVTRSQRLTFDRSSPMYGWTYLSLDFILDYY
jgi:hypothetical protein